MTSCGTTKYVPTEEDELTQIWAGKEYQDIVQSYGEPDRIEMDGDDGSILVYEEQAPVSERVPPVPTIVTGLDHEREMNFFLNPEGYCYLVSTNRSVPGSDTEKHGLKKPLIVVGGDSRHRPYGPHYFFDPQYRFQRLEIAIRILLITLLPSVYAAVLWRRCEKRGWTCAKRPFSEAVRPTEGGRRSRAGESFPPSPLGAAA